MAENVARDSGADYARTSEVIAQIDETVDSTLELNKSREELAKNGKKIDETLEDNLNKLPDWQDSVVNAATAVTSFASALSALGGIWDTLNDPDLSGWEKLTTVFTTLLSVVPGVMMGFKSLQDSKIKDVAINALNTASEKILAKAKKDTADASK
mgnify:CR=1 FL=1